MPWASVAASTPEWASPAPLVSTGVTGMLGVWAAAPPSANQEPCSPARTSTVPSLFDSAVQVPAWSPGSTATPRRAASRPASRSLSDQIGSRALMLSNALNETEPTMGETSNSDRQPVRLLASLPTSLSSAVAEAASARE